MEQKKSCIQKKKKLPSLSFDIYFCQALSLSL